MSEMLVRTLCSQFRDVHERIRSLVRRLEPGALDWTPGDGTNSISTLVTHVVGSEIEVLTIVRGAEGDRDRASEFTAHPQDAPQLLARLDRADALLAEFAETVNEGDLALERARPSAQRSVGARTGLFWLLNNYGHAREHLAHIELTLQLYRQRA